MQSAGWRGYAAAALAVLAATLLRAALAPLLGAHYPLGTFYAAVAVAGWFWGVGPAVLATLLGYPLGAAFFLQPGAGAAAVQLPALELIMYVAICGALIALVYRVHERQQQLLHSDARFKRYLDAMPDIVYTWAADGSLDYLSPRWLQYSGATAAGAEEVAARVPEQDLQLLRARRRDSLREGAPLRAEFRLRDRHGQLRWFLTRCVPIRDAGDAIIGWVGSSIDVDEEKRAQAARDQAWQRLRMITDAMPVGVAQCNRELQYVWANPAYARQLGSTPEQMQGRSLEEIIGREALERLQPHIARVLAGERTEYEALEEISGQPGRWIHAVYTPIWNGAAAPVGWVALVSDMSERRALEQQLRDANRQKDRFLATLAHELRNPLAPIRYATRLLKPEVPAGMAADARRMIDRQLEQMARLLDDLLDVSRVSRGALAIQQQALDLRTTLRQAVEAARPLAETVGHRLRLELPERALPVLGDEARLIQVVGNLINNAIKYTDAGGEIVVSAGEETGQVRISVRDNGSGIAPELLPHVFEMFTQGERGARAQSGLGIGLALAQQIIELHGGRIEARSEGPGRGSEFCIWLARIDEVPAIQEPRAESANITVLGAADIHVLIVDDNADAADALAQLLQSAGYRTHVAYDGRTALEMAEILRPAVALLDLGLPQLSGRELAQRLRTLPWGHQVRLIAITGWGGADEVRSSQLAGFDEHLTKPVDPELLIQHLVRLTRSAA